jgi:hypothetical protein
MLIDPYLPTYDVALIWPGVALVMRRARRRIEAEAERRAALPVLSGAGV